MYCRIAQAAFFAFLRRLRINNLHFINTAAGFKSTPPTKSSAILLLPVSQILRVAIEPFACLFLVGSRVLVPSSKTWNNLEPFAIDRFF